MRRLPAVERMERKDEQGNSENKNDGLQVPVTKGHVFQETAGQQVYFCESGKP